MADKIQNNLYLLKESSKEKNKKTKKIEEKSIDFAFLNKLMKSKGFKEQAVFDGLSKSYEIKVYYKKAITDVKWKGFIKTIVTANEEILKTNTSSSESYVIFIKNVLTDKYYASTGGYAHIIVQDIAVNDFGLEILSRIVKSEDKALKSTKELNLTGGVQGAIKFFRNDYNLYENESFGNIYNELSAAINKQQLVSIFGFTIKDLKSDSLCIAKNSFSLKKSISFDELLVIINKCEDLLSKPPIVEINSVQKINKSNIVLLEDLENQLYKKMYNNYKDENDFFSIEISHKDFEKYFYAAYSKLIITINRKKVDVHFDENIRDIQVVLSEIREINSSLDDRDFKKSIDSAIIETYDTNGTKLTSGTLTNHFCSEIVYGSKSYFLIEKDWFEVRKSFIDKINEQCQSFLENNNYTGPLMDKWNKGKENEYNSLYLGKQDTFVFDKFTPQNIEVCDILKFDSNATYFYHVKKGFDNSMRDLCSQVQIAARKVNEDSKMGYSYLELLYDTVAGNNGDSQYSKSAKATLLKTSKTDFINLIKTKKLIFVLAVLDTSKKKRSLKTNIKDFGSNIAKFSLNELSKNMRNLGVDFQILQLEK